MRILAALFVFAAAAAAQQTDARPAYLGVSLAPIGPTRDRFEIDPDLTQGAVLLAVAEGSAAARAGWRAGDVVVRFDGKEVGSVEDLIALVRARKAGDHVGYELRRRGGRIAGRVVLRTRPATDERPEPETAPVEPAPATLEQRLARIQKEIEAMRRRVQAESRPDDRPPAPRTLGGWIEREQRAAKAALARGDQARARWHETRLSVLREMRAAGARPPRAAFERMDKKLDEILRLLRRDK